MTDKVLNDYYEHNKDMYMSLIKNCSSIPELLLKIEIYGKKWNQWDWVLLFSSMLNFMSYNFNFNSNLIKNTILLYHDIILTIDNSNDLDKILTNRSVLINIIYVINNIKIKFWTRDLQIKLCALLAHIFKKFPRLWNISWMYSKYLDQSTRKWVKYHRLTTSVYTQLHRNQNDKYYKSNNYYNEFMKLYANL